jgi:glycosyltransferase involved in cell wall biosynthesis
MDSQGVSRDEAMSSGLVPITTDITAIPEFVDAESGILTPPENYKAMSKGILDLYDDPDKFLQMSRNAANRVRKQTDSRLIIDAELKLIKGD